MAEKLLKYYKFIREEQGIPGMVKLAQLTKIPSPIAATEPDSPENIQLFRNHIEAITGKVPPIF